MLLFYGFYGTPVALQEHAEDDLQVDGPGETDTDVDEALPPPPPETDSAQLARKIKELIASKGAASSKRAAEAERSESTESVKKSPVSEAQSAQKSPVSETQSAQRSPSSASSGWLIVK